MKYIASVILLVSLSSCGLFSTREPELPTVTSNSQIPATTPDILFINFKSSIEAKVLDNYLACFADPSFISKKFTFTASAAATVQFPVLSYWGIEAERQYFNNLKTISLTGNSITLSLTNKVNTPLGDSSIYQVDYALNVITKDQSITGDYKGTAQFKIYLDKRNQWVIGSWEDTRKSEQRSWSDLKGRLY
ncbi:MAG: hypothetical protein FD143_170 [Ignavibacteria bacterium]|nr:MAG: hypothetical protein FD143_170 [Ignavibacteria bacterium]KAF0162415.1 MAG: hypothetical protein FD188_18 [Ignavibacteria bacterium]